MTIFVRTFDFLTWLTPITNHFPRAHRHGVTWRLLDAAFDLRERLRSSRRGAEWRPPADSEAMPNEATPEGYAHEDTLGHFKARRQTRRTIA